MPLAGLAPSWPSRWTNHSPRWLAEISRTPNGARSVMATERTSLPTRFDAILINAGVTHPHERWLDALKAGGRLVVPLTFTVPAMGPIGKGVMALLTRDGDVWNARMVTMTVIYNAIDLRDSGMNDRIRDAFMQRLPAFTRMRLDTHEPSTECWLHGDTFCLSK